MVFGGGTEVDVPDLDVVAAIDEDEVFDYLDVFFNKEPNIESITRSKRISRFIPP